mgnify:CR=1 FL=1
MSEIKSLDAQYPYVSQREELFNLIVLDIKDKKKIEEAFDSMIKPEILEGDNKYKIDDYNVSVRA